MKSYISLLLILLSIGLLSCDKNDTEIACDIKDPVNNLPWLKTKIEAFQNSNFCEENDCNMKIYKVVSGNQQLLVTWVTGPAVDSMPQYYTCNGEMLNCTATVTCPDMINAELIWTSNSR